MIRSWRGRIAESDANRKAVRDVSALLDDFATCVAGPVPADFSRAVAFRAAAGEIDGIRCTAIAERAVAGARTLATSFGGEHPDAEGVPFVRGLPELEYFDKFCIWLLSMHARVASLGAAVGQDTRGAPQCQLQHDSLELVVAPRELPDAFAERVSLRDGLTLVDHTGERDTLVYARTKDGKTWRVHESPRHAHYEIAWTDDTLFAVTSNDGENHRVHVLEGEAWSPRARLPIWALDGIAITPGGVTV